MSAQIHGRPTAPPVPAAPPRVLLAEDDPVARMLTTRLLRKAGYDVVAVENGNAALEALRSDFVPILLTDWEMPGLDGLGLIGAIRGGVWPGYVYTLLLTGRDSREHVLAGLGAGADDYLTKPVDEAELLARMKTARRVAELEQGLRAAQQEAVRLSITDALTNVCNRRHLMDELPREVERARRYTRPLSVVLCDIDHFKKINDTWGHAAGDEVLRAFSALLAGSMRREIDWVARYGGEEFVIVLPETELSGAVTVAEKLRASTAELEVRVGEDVIRLTSSFGVSSLQTHWPEAPLPEALIEQADLCLYQSKERGRNRVTGALLPPK